MWYFVIPIHGEYLAAGKKPADRGWYVEKLFTYQDEAIEQINRWIKQYGGERVR